MPIIQVPVTNNEEKIYYHEPNRRIRTIDLNTLSGASLADSNLLILMQLAKGLTGNFDPLVNTYLGFKIATYTPNNISTNIGYVVKNDGSSDGVYTMPALTLTPNSGAWWGFYEIEFVQTTSDNVGLDFFDGVVGSFASSPTRKVFQLNIYENFNNTATFPTLTPGRVKWIEYKRSGASPADVIVSVNNLISKNQVSLSGFQTGDVKYSMKPGDGVDWVTCTGGVIPNTNIDLISFLREVTINPTPLSFTGLDSDSGLVRLTLPALTNLKNVRFGGDPKYACVSILSSTGSVSPVSSGVYRINNIVGNQITLQLAYNVSFAGATGTFDINPFANEDAAGGGARTPFPDFIRGQGATGDINRLVNTYEDGQVENHTHTPNLSVNSSLTGVASGNLSGNTLPAGYHQHNIFGQITTNNLLFTAGTPGIQPVSLRYAPGGGDIAAYDMVTSPSTPDRGITSDPIIGGAPSPTHVHPINGNVFLDISSLGINTNSSLTLDNYGGQDNDNPNQTRPDNLSLYLLIKT